MESDQKSLNNDIEINPIITLIYDILILLIGYFSKNITNFINFLFFELCKKILFSENFHIKLSFLGYGHVHKMSVGFSSESVQDSFASGNNCSVAFYSMKKVYLSKILSNMIIFNSFFLPFFPIHHPFKNALINKINWVSNMFIIIDDYLIFLGFDFLHDSNQTINLLFIEVLEQEVISAAEEYLHVSFFRFDWCFWKTKFISLSLSTINLRWYSMPIPSQAILNPLSSPSNEIFLRNTFIRIKILIFSDILPEPLKRIINNIFWSILH